MGPVFPQSQYANITRTATRKKWRLLYTDVSSVIVTVFDPIYSDLLQTFDTVVLRLSIEDTAELFEYGHDTVEYWWTGEHSNGFFEELYSPDYVYRFSDGYPFTQSTSIHTLEVVLPVKESQQIAAGAIAADANVFVGRMKEEVQHTLSRCWAPEAKGLQHVRIVNDTDGTEMFHKEVDRSYELELAEYRRKQAEGEEQLQQRLREKQASVFEKFEGLRCAV